MNQHQDTNSTTLQLKRTPRRWIRYVGTVAVLSMPAACGFCIPKTIHPLAIQHNTFCAQYLQQGQLTEAEARCKLAIEYAPKYAEPYNLLGMIEYARGKRDAAATYFKQALSFKNDFAEAHNNLGGLFLEDHHYDEACDEFKQACEIDPGYQVARRNYATCLMYNGEPRKAKDEYLKCVEVDPQACDCRMGLGVLALNDEDFSAAKSHFQKSTEICPQDPKGFFNLCIAFYRMSRCSDAVDACIGALALKPDYIEARQNLTASYECLALQDQSLKEFEDQLRRDPGNPDTHFKLGTMFEDKGLFDRALTEYHNTIKLNPKHLLSYYRAARVLDRQLRAQETVQMCQQFVDLIRDTKYDQQKSWCVTRVKELQFQQ